MDLKISDKINLEKSKHLTSFRKRISVCALLCYMILLQLAFSEEKKLTYPEDSRYILLAEAISQHFPIFKQTFRHQEAVTTLLINIGFDWYNSKETFNPDEGLASDICAEEVTQYERKFDHKISHFCRIAARFASHLNNWLQQHTKEEFLQIINDINPHLAVTFRYLEEHESFAGNSLVKSNYSQFNSYIFLIWTKLPGRVTDWGHVIPNTGALPHQQTILDWGRLNPDKYVVLWFDSLPLNDEELGQYIQFREILQAHYSNINVLDIRQADWSNKSFSVPTYNPPTDKTVVLNLTTVEAMNNELIMQDLGNWIDLLKTRLLYEGSDVIRTAMLNSLQRLSIKALPSLMPSKGVYFDLDYIPQYFSGEQLYQHGITVDDTNGFVSAEGPTMSGKLVRGSDLMFGLISTNQDKSPLLGELLPPVIDGKTEIYQTVREILIKLRTRLAGTKQFRMLGAKYEEGTGTILRRIHPFAESWSLKKDHTEANQQKNKPLSLY